MSTPNTPGEALMERICKMLEEHGCPQYVVVFGDPDSNYDRLKVFGSRFWRSGVGMELIDDVKQIRRQEREDEPTED
jgi:hypothetical protein